MDRSTNTLEPHKWNDLMIDLDMICNAAHAGKPLSMILPITCFIASTALGAEADSPQAEFAFDKEPEPPKPQNPLSNIFSAPLNGLPIGVSSPD